jgi:predicted DNA-binding protein with PD1-like motif
MKIWVAVLTSCIFLSCQSNVMKEDHQRVHAFRLNPGEDLKAGIENIVRENNVKAVWIATCAGRLSGYAIRYAIHPGERRGSRHLNR